jgi:glucuronosyltransferase
MLDRAVEGIIYFSLGGNFRSADLPESTLNAFVNVFSSMRDVLVMWKFETVDLKERHPHNVVIGPSMPQQEILSHKHLRAFITHGGLLSLMEAVHYGKPVIGIPIFNDQKFNMAQASSQGYGITLNYDNITESSLRTALDTIFNDTSYRENAERMSARFKDNPIKALDKAVWYVEHAINSNGAHHLQMTATKLSFLQIHLIDQIAFAALIIAAVMIALSKAVKLAGEKFQKRKKFSPLNTTKKAAVSAVEKRSKLKSN